MTDDKAIQVFEFYQEQLREYAIPGAQETPDYPTGCNHLLYMATAGPVMIRAGRRDKAMRWLGFIQGVLVSKKWFTLEDVKNHSRPLTDKEAK